MDNEAAANDEKPRTIIIDNIAAAGKAITIAAMPKYRAVSSNRNFPESTENISASRLRGNRDKNMIAEMIWPDATRIEPES